MLTLMDPVSWKEKRIREAVNTCSSGLYVTNCTRDSLQRRSAGCKHVQQRQ